MRSPTVTVTAKVGSRTPRVPGTSPRGDERQGVRRLRSSSSATAPSDSLRDSKPPVDNKVGALGARERAERAHALRQCALAPVSR